MTWESVDLGSLDGRRWIEVRIDSNLLRIMGLLYKQTVEDQQVIFDQLLEQRKTAWRSTIQREARQYGYTGPAEGPRYQDLDYIKDLCRQDAQSIVNTWNRDVERHLRQLFEVNPRGNRYYYAKHMEAWASERAAWKNRQIATQTEYTVVGYAKERFAQENGLRGALYTFDGPPAVCGECVGLFAEGVVDQAFVDAHPTPVHIGCPHTWKRIKGSVPSPYVRDLWVG